MSDVPNAVFLTVARTLAEVTLPWNRPCETRLSGTGARATLFD